MRKAIILVIISLLLMGCSVDYKVDVKSDTSWSGAFGNRTVDGQGNKTVDIADDPPVCVVVQKQTERGYLTIQIIAKGGGIFGPDDNAPVTTRAAYGVVSDCSD